MKQKKEIRLEDIARKLNISIVTVSNALSGKKGVSDSLRDTIIRTAEELGYDVSRYRERKREDGFKFGVLLPERYLDLPYSFQWMLYQQIVCAASKRDIAVFLKIVEDGAGLDEAGLNRWIGSVDGLLDISGVRSGRAAELLQIFKIPAVMFGDPEPVRDRMLICDAVRQNPYMGVCKAAGYLLERGHEDIAFVDSVDVRDRMRERYMGFCRGMKEYGKAVKKEWIIRNSAISEDAVCTEHIALPEKMPTAFVCASSHTAWVLYEELLQRGFRVPEDVSLIAYDYSNVPGLAGHIFLKQLTTCSPDIRMMAETAVDILLRRKRSPDTDYGTVYVDNRITEGKSVKEIKALWP